MACKYYCDKCHKESIDWNLTKSEIGNVYIRNTYIRFDLCKKCHTELSKRVKEWLKA